MVPSRTAARRIVQVVSLGLATVLASGIAGDRIPRREAPQRIERGTERARIAGSFGRLPLSFEANAGQTADDVAFLSRGTGYALFLTAADAVFTFKRPDSASDVVMRMKLAGSTPARRVEPIDPLVGRTSYFKGESTRWRTGIRNYRKVRYEGVYPGIDLIYYGNQRQLEYDFVVAPGADPGVIRIEFTGVDAMRTDGAGDLVLAIGGIEVRQRKPSIYQEVGGVRQAIAGGYSIAPDGRIGFDLSAHDPALPLVIDPILVYSSYLGGQSTGGPIVIGGDQGWDIAVDAEGSAYITGQAYAPDFPVTPGAVQTTTAGSPDAFVTKISADGSTILYSTYLGGSAPENFFGTRGGDPGIAVDAAGNAYVTGETHSDGDFPTTPGAFRRSGGSVFVTKIDPTGSALVYSTLIGEGSGDAIAVDPLGYAYVAGGLESIDFPTRNPLMPTRANRGAFVLKLNPQGSDLVYSTYLGGTFGVAAQPFDSDYAAAIALDAAGDVYVGGRARSLDFPIVNAAQPIHGGSSTVDGFVTKIHASGSFIIYSTFVGGAGRDAVADIAVDATSGVHAAGFTASANFPLVNALQAVPGGGTDAFIARLSPAGSQIVFSTLLGGTGDDRGDGLALDSRGNMYVAGATESPDFPLVRPPSPSLGTGLQGDAFVAKLSAGGSSILYSTYLGGDTLDFAAAIDVDASGDAYVTGSTFLGTSAAGTFPVVNAFQPEAGGGIDAFVAKISDPSGDCPDEATDRVQIYRLGMQALWLTPVRFEWVLIRNISSGPMTGPLALVVDDVENAVFIGSTRSTSCVGSARTPFAVVPIDRDGVLSPDESVLTGVWFYKTAIGRISYTPRVLAAVPLQ